MVHRFVRHHDKTYTTAVETLKALVAQSGIDMADRAYAEAVTPCRSAFYEQGYGLKRASGHQCLHRLLGRKVCPMLTRHCRTHTPSAPCHLPGADHETLWYLDRDTLLYVSQPYGLTWGNVQQSTRICAQWGLEMYIDAAPSWHFPGRVLTVEVATADAWRRLSVARDQRHTAGHTSGEDSHE
jgi:hypothetical protein